MVVKYSKKGIGNKRIFNVYALHITVTGDVLLYYERDGKKNSQYLMCEVNFDSMIITDKKERR